MGISVERAERILRQGAETVGGLLDDLPEGAVRERAAAAKATFEELAWGYAKDGNAYMLPGHVTSDAYLVLLPDREVGHLKNPAPFQTEPYEDGTIRLNVRTVSFTKLWAGLVLFHELSHVHDYLSGIEPREGTRNQYLEGEIRAYQLEMALLDAATSGRLTTALETFVHEPLDPVWIAASGADLARRVEAMTAGPGAQPPGSNHEASLRDGFYRIAPLLASQWAEPNAVRVAEPETARRTLGRFFNAAN